jgi:curved DNA-binding protein CbpA
MNSGSTQDTRMRLAEAFRLIFPHDGSDTACHRPHVDPRKLKTAFRTRIKQCHPDKSLLLGMSPEVLKRQFEELRQAYEILRDFAQRDYSKQNEPLAAAPGPRGTAHHTVSLRTMKLDLPPMSKPVKHSALSTDFFYHGPVPPIPLRLGRYLYYRGLISWKTLVQSIEWQRKKRPSLGHLAISHKFLKPADVALIMYRHAQGKAFGQAARDLGKLTAGQIDRILKIQQAHKARIGDFFIENGVLSPGQIDQVLSGLSQHNRRYSYG